MNSNSLTLLGFGASFRAHSYNRGLLLAAQELMPSQVKFEIFDLHDIPLYNQDEEKSPAPAIVEFKSKIRQADALLIATPEYNYSVPGFLKNAIDCASRPYGDNVFAGKAAAIMGATIGTLGTSRAQYHLRQICVSLNMYLLSQPEIMVSAAAKKFDQQGKLIDVPTREKIETLLKEFIQFVYKVKK